MKEEDRWQHLASTVAQLDKRKERGEDDCSDAVG